MTTSISCHVVKHVEQASTYWTCQVLDKAGKILLQDTVSNEISIRDKLFELVRRWQKNHGNGCSEPLVSLAMVAGASGNQSSVAGSQPASSELGKITGHDDAS